MKDSKSVIKPLSSEIKESQRKNLVNSLKVFAQETHSRTNSRSAMPDLSKSDSFDSHYQFKSHIAEGGIKAVNKMRDNQTGRDVAMAFLKDKYRSTINSERFLREARILASLEHQNIVPLYEIGYDSSDQLYFTMKMLSGVPLSEVLKHIQNKKEGYAEKYILDDLLHIFLDVCDAMSYAHSAGVIHLDLKPGNIQVGDFGEVSILDWGFAKQIDEESVDDYQSNDDFRYAPISDNLTQAGTIKGTPGFMSPEQSNPANGKPGIHSDIYALGAILYNILYLRRPYHNLTVEGITKATGEGEELPYPEKLKDRIIPPALIAVTKKAMQFDPELRYDTVEELKQDIRLYLTNFMTEAEDTNIIRFSKLFYRRHKKSIHISAVILSIFGSVVYSAYSTIQENNQIAKAQQLKMQATKSEVIEGTNKKHEALRKKYAFDEILANYEKLKAVGYNYPEFWFEEAKLHAGELNFKQALFCLNKVLEFKTEIKSSEKFKKMLEHVRIAAELPDGKSMDFPQLMDFTLNMDSYTQAHIIWNMNRNSGKSTKEVLDQLPSVLKWFNKESNPNEINYKYDITNSDIKVDLSNNPNLVHIRPLLGIKMDELDISNAWTRPGSISYYLKHQLTVLRISGCKINFINEMLEGGKIEKLIAKNTEFSAYRFDRFPSLKYLDLEGANIRREKLAANDTLEYLNIAFSMVQNYKFLNGFRGLKTLVIEEQNRIPLGIIEKLKSRGTKIVFKKERS